MISKKRIKIYSIIRTIVFALAVINQIIAVIGKGSVSVYQNDVVQIVSVLFTAASSVMVWWKNNSFTGTAIEADLAKKELEIYEDENGADK